MARRGLRGGDVRTTVASYRQLHDEAAGGDVARRRTDYTHLTRKYYDLVTDFYERGWGRSFHFAPRRRDESLRESILRHEHYVAMRLGLEPDMRVLDVGCGIAGPLCNVARFAGVRVTGLNSNGYQVERGRENIRRAGLEGRCEVVQGDFMQMPFEEGSFDAAYDLEALVHAPDLQAAMAQVHRALRPGGRFVSSDWCLTDAFDPDDPEHRRIKKGIEEGNGLPDIPTMHQLREAIEGAGLVVHEVRDMTTASDPETPWYLPLTSRDRSLRGVRLSRPGRVVTEALVRTLEGARMAPSGSVEVARLLQVAADSLVEGGRRGIFTPLVVAVAEKPAR